MKGIRVMDFAKPILLGQTGLEVGRLGIGAGYGAPCEAFEAAFERGCNYFYWTSRKDGMKKAIRNICASGKRDKLLISIQSYSRFAGLLESSLKKALRELSVDYADVLILGWHNKLPSQRLIQKAIEMKKNGMYKFLGLSGHNHSAFLKIAELNIFDLFHIRYNAAHRKAERIAFPNLKNVGIVSYTATCWGALVNPKKMPSDEQPLSSTDCYRFALTNNAVNVCLCGPKNMEQMEMALKSLKSGPLSLEELDRIKGIGDYVYKQNKFF